MKLYSLVLALPLLLIPASAGAQTPSVSDEAARARLIDDGVAARASADHARALDLFQRAGAIRMRPSLRQFIAEELQSLGRYVDALEVAGQCLRDVETDHGAPHRRTVLLDCRDLVRALQSRVAMVEVVPPTPTPEGLRILVQGQELRPDLWGVSTPVMPGSIRVEATTPRGRFEVEEQAAAGAILRVRVMLRPVTLAPVPSPAPPQTEPRVAPLAAPVGLHVSPPSNRARTGPGPRTTSAGGPGVGPWILGGVGVAMLGGALATFLLEGGADSQQQMHCQESNPQVFVCDDDGVALDARRDTLRVVNNVLFWGGLAAVGGATVWYLLGRSSAVHRPATGWNLLVAPSSAGLTLGIQGAL